MSIKQENECDLYFISHVISTNMQRVHHWQECKNWKECSYCQLRGMILLYSQQQQRTKFILLLLGLTYFPLIHQFAGCTRSRQIVRRILHPIRHHSHIKELNNPRWGCDMTMSFCLFFQIALAPRKLRNMRSFSFRLSAFPHSASKYWTTCWGLKELFLHWWILYCE